MLDVMYWFVIHLLLNVFFYLFFYSMFGVSISLVALTFGGVCVVL